MLEFAVKTKLICVFSSPFPDWEGGMNFTVKIDKWQRSQILSSCLLHSTYLPEAQCLLPTLRRSRGLRCFRALFCFCLALQREVCVQVMPQLWHGLSPVPPGLCPRACHTTCVLLVPCPSCSRCPASSDLLHFFVLPAEPGPGKAPKPFIFS